MKIKVIKSKSGIIADYLKAKNASEIRINILRFIVEMAKTNLTFVVDTNISDDKIPIAEIKEIMDNYCEEYSIEPTVKTERKAFGLSGLFGSKKKPKMDENIIILRVSKEKFKEELYDSFLKYYDYGITLDNNMTTQEMLKASSGELDELLFNKDVLDVTFYDSLLFSRIRTDSKDDAFQEYLNTLTKSKS